MGASTVICYFFLSQMISASARCRSQLQSPRASTSIWSGRCCVLSSHCGRSHQRAQMEASAPCSQASAVNQVHEPTTIVSGLDLSPCKGEPLVKPNNVVVEVVRCASQANRLFPFKVTLAFSHLISPLRLFSHRSTALQGRPLSFLMLCISAHLGIDLPTYRAKVLL